MKTKPISKESFEIDARYLVKTTDGDFLIVKPSIRFVEKNDGQYNDFLTLDDIEEIHLIEE